VTFFGRFATNRFENVDRGETEEAPVAAGCGAWTAAALSLFVATRQNRWTVCID